MRLANGIIIDKEKTFGVLKFSALRREVHIQNEDGTVSEEIKERTYDLKCKEQGRMIQVSIPASVPLKEFDYNAEVEIINPVADTVATATFQGADVDWYIKADDIVLKNMTDVAYYFIDECQSLGEIPDRIRSYIDYEAYGRDLDLEGCFVVTNHGVFECPY